MSALRLTDLNDFIEPAQTCIKPPVASSRARKTAQAPAGPEVELDTGVSSKSIDETVSINLGDCLACSGCITSAETVLVAQQTHAQLMQVLQEKGHRRVVVSLSTPSLVAVAAAWKCGVQAVYGRVKRGLRAMGVDEVLPMSVATDICLAETAHEFVDRLRTSQSSCSASAAALPVLTSACPGWICYAEKLQHSLLPLISAVRSPQQAMGTIVKHFLSAHRWNVPPRDVYHVTVMSCYDKKLEASRADFADEVVGVRDVDCVITTGELLAILPASVDDTEAVHDADSCIGEEDELYVHLGSSAGGYLEYTLRSAALHLFGISIPPSLEHPQLHISAGRDLCEYTLYSQALSHGNNKTDGRSDVLLRFASVYGFRNIQNLVRRLKRPTTTTAAPPAAADQRGYDFVEVMACPSACLNGGGQPKPPPTTDGRLKSDRARQQLAELQQLYATLPHRDPLCVGDEHPAYSSEKVYREWFGGRGSPLLHTFYTAIRPSEDMNRSFRVQW